jgi:hypothetical protein
VPPPVIKSLFDGTHPQSKLFNESSCAFNNALAFGSAIPQLSIQVLGIWRPSLIVRGAVEARSAACTSRRGRRPDSRRFTSAECEVAVRLGHLFTGCTALLSRGDAAAYQRAAELLRDLQKELKSVNPIVQDLLSVATTCVASPRSTRSGVIVKSERSHHQHRRRAARAVAR